jgi:hypothetical protein
MSASIELPRVERTLLSAAVEVALALEVEVGRLAVPLLTPNHQIIAPVKITVQQLPACGDLTTSTHERYQ